MANVEARVIEDLLDEIDDLERAIERKQNMSKTEMSATKANDVRDAVTGGATKFDAARWSQLSAESREQLLRQLIAARDELLETGVKDDSRETAYLPLAGAATNKAVIWLAIFGFIFAATLFFLIR